MTESEYAIRPNKTQLKREIKMLNKLGQELIALPDSALSKVPLSDTMREAIGDGKRFQRGALQRQLRRIASLMQYEDVAAIQLALAQHKHPSKQQTERLHKLEQWREQLIDGDEALLTEIIDQYPSTDRQHIRQLVRNATRERAEDRSPKSARLLFKYLSQLTEEHDMESGA